MLVRTFSLKNNASVEIFVKSKQIREVPYLFYEVLVQQNEMLMISFKLNGFGPIRAILTITLHLTLEGDDKSIRAILVHDCIHKHFELLIRVTLVDERHQSAWFS